MIWLLRPRARFWKKCWLSLPGTLLTLSAAAQDLAAGSGASDTDDHTGASYAWLIQLHETLSPGLGGSFTWVNEGHLLD